MQTPQIQIRSQFAQIQMQTLPSRQEIQQPKAQLSIEQPKADLSISRIPSKLTIDQTQAWEDMGLMHVFRSNEIFAQNGRQGLLEGISRRAQQGDELMRIENGGNPIVSQANANGYDSMKQIGIKFIPSHNSVKISYQPTEVQIDVKQNEPNITVQPQKPIHNYEPGSIDISMKQYAELEIDFVV
ncbi:DUF6470 family protein [Ornithinibacillus halophilus]|uniref:YviE n=1 Tax=Ornithinibacillus halophilus TaxID=930117 RepID=A0A1M5FCA7_9BACI|nr:DUF6470 family protein [Ornithinibacillus halophilus]SHF89223.1 hypothetical protein SAMN05216225_100824 [Ornithinibacillus halophilus]